MYVGGAPLSASAPPEKPGIPVSAKPIDFQDVLDETTAQIAEAEKADPMDVDLESVAAHALGIADEEEEKKKREKRRKDAADGPGTSSAAPSAQEAFEMAQKWLMKNYQVSERILDSLQAAGADVTESAAPDAAKLGEVAPATVATSGAETATVVKPPTGVAFI